MPHRKPFIDFINDFDLLNVDNVVVFNAVIKVAFEELNIEARCEVHIVTSLPNSFCTLYLLHSDSRINDIPTMFESDKTSVEYFPNKFLKIETHTFLKDKVNVYVIPDEAIRKQN